MQSESVKKSIKQKQMKNKDKKQATLQLFAKQNPLSLNGKSIYRQDYESIFDHNWLRTEAIGSLITIFQKMFASKIDEMVQSQLKTQNFKDNQIKTNDLKQRLKNYVKIIDPFIVTMILTTQQDFILQTLQGLQIFNSQTKYILFPMNTQFMKGNHWFLSLIKNPRYQGFTYNSMKQQSKSQKKLQLFILNSMPSSKNDTSIYMVNELSQQLTRLLKLFHPTQKSTMKFIGVQKVTHQSNSYDCGILTIAFIQEILFNYVLQNEILRILKLKLWKNSSENLKQQQTAFQIDQNSQFFIVKSSIFLRKFYRQLLQKQILYQNSALFTNQT